MKNGFEAKTKKEMTIKDVAQIAGVSQATVGRVVGGYGSVSEKTRKKVLKAVKEMNYVPNAIAQSMKSKNTKTIGVVIGNIANPFFSEIVHAIEVKSADAGFNLIISNTGEDIQREIASLKILQSKRVDGLIIATTQPSNKVFDETERSLYYGIIPTVYIDREIFSVGELCVKTDHFGGAYDVTDYLIKLGHKNIGIIGGLQTSTMQQRIEGHKKAILDNGLEFKKEYIKFGDVASIEQGKLFTKELLEEQNEVTAIFALNNLLCTGTLLAVKEMGVRIPNDISLVGWDDFPLANIIDPPLTVITQNTDKIGTLATEKLLEIIDANETGREVFGEKRITLKTNFIFRDSCRKI